MKKISGEIVKAVEIKKNILLLFRKEYERPSNTFFCTIFTIYKYDVENQEIEQLSEHYIRDVDESVFTLHYFNYYLNNDYLFVRYGHFMKKIVMKMTYPI